eukprot:9100732-Pyramimonas_sp.AAC.1
MKVGAPRRAPPVGIASPLRPGLRTGPPLNRARPLASLALWRVWLGRRGGGSLCCAMARSDPRRRLTA